MADLPTPPDHRTLRRTNTAWAFLLCTALVVYGSLVPLEYVPLAWDAAVLRFTQIPWLALGADQRADWVANGIAYLPIGALGALSLLPQRPRFIFRLLALLLASALCAALAVGVEFIQVFFPQRTVSLNDVTAEIIGSSLGALLGVSVLEQWWPRQGWWQRMALAPQQLGVVYGLALMALGLFPFDLLISAQEWHQKLAGPSVAWWVSDATREGGLKQALARLALEVLASAPLALALKASPHQTAGVWVLRAGMAGAAFGLVLETLQLFMVSTITQGASVLTRALGVGLGATVLQRAQHMNAAALHLWARRLTAVGLPIHALVIAWLSGWFKAPWQSPEAAWQMLSTDVRFMPFYYHYFTTELDAVTSAVKVASLYAPLGLWVWALRAATASVLAGAALQPRTVDGTLGAAHKGRVSAAALAGAALGALMCAAGEVGRLMAGLRPDPSNLIIAAVAASVLAALLTVWARPTAGSAPLPSDRQPSPSGAASPSIPSTTIRADIAPVQPDDRRRFAESWAWLVLAGLAAAAWVSGMTWGWPLLTPVILVITAGSVAWRPLWLPGVVVALAMLMDPRPWAGQQLVGEYDLVLVTLWALALWRTPRLEHPVSDKPTAFVLVLVTLSALLSTSQTVLAWAITGLPLATEPLGSLRGLEACKGVLWGVAFLWWARWRAGPQATVTLVRSTIAGVALGTVGTVAVMGWEWWALGGSLRMQEPLRLSGPLADMANGGNSNEAILCMSLVVCVVAALESQGRPARAALAVAAMAAAVGMVMSYSRAAHLALVVMVGLVVSMLLMGWIRQRHGRLRTPTTLMASVGALAVAALAWTALMSVAGPGASQRLQNIEQEALERLTGPWESFRLHTGSVHKVLFGMGWGAWPAVRYGTALPGEHVLLSSVGGMTAPADGAGGLSITLATGDSGGSLNQMLRRLEPGVRSVNVELAWRPLRSDQGGEFQVLLCRKWFLNSQGCTSHTLSSAPASGTAPGAWRHVAFTLTPEELAEARDARTSGLATLPLMVALHHTGSGPVMIQDVRIAAGNGVLVGGTAPRTPAPRAWLSMSDAHRAWKIESAYASVLWERGALGLVAAGAWWWLLARSRRVAHAGCGVQPVLLLMTGLAAMGIWDTWSGSGRAESILILLALALQGASRAHGAADVDRGLIDGRVGR